MLLIVAQNAASIYDDDMRSTMNISLPPDLKNWLNAQVQEGGYGTASEYVRDVFRRIRERQERERIDGLLLEAVEDGVVGVMDARYWARLRNSARKAARADQRAKGSR